MAGMCDGRVCIVTGAGRGLGREYAVALAREGASVVVNTEQVIEASGMVFGLAEGWHAGPSAQPTQNPEEVDAAMCKLLAQVRPQATTQDRS